MCFKILSEKGIIPTLKRHFGYWRLQLTWSNDWLALEFHQLATVALASCYPPFLSMRWCVHSVPSVAFQLTWWNLLKLAQEWKRAKLYFWIETIAKMRVHCIFSRVHFYKSVRKVEESVIKYLLIKMCLINWGKKYWTQVFHNKSLVISSGAQIVIWIFKLLMNSWKIWLK